MSSFSLRPISWPSIVLSPSRNLHPQPPFFVKQIQPPPYSVFPLIMKGPLQAGHFRSDCRQRNFVSIVEHDPSPEPITRPVGICVNVQTMVISLCPFSIGV